MPREPVSSTLLAGRPATNCRVLRVDRLLLRVDRDEVGEPTACGCATACRKPRPPRLRQRAAVTLRPVGVRLGRRQQRLDPRRARRSARATSASSPAGSAT